MPSFLSKVFGRKKQDDKEPSRPQRRVSELSLLDGKFEAVSPSAIKFPEVANGKGNGHGKDRDKDGGFTLFRAKSRPASPDTVEKRTGIPHLSLNLPGPKEGSSSRALGVVFEGDPDAQLLLADSVIGDRRLNTLETLILVRACSQAIATRGLETLGIMHPHWYSASPDIQRRLISLFIQSLAPKSPITTLSPTPSAIVSAFESEISSTRSPHDVAAVLRWGLRHLQLDDNAFGNTHGWYQNFLEAERSSGYPSNAFSTQLAPQIPAAHLELLTATLEILSSLAAHAEANGVSGSKLAKFFGLWLLTTHRAEENDDWFTFYGRWERTGRILEHLLLSRIRDEASSFRMPTRLLELVHHYPYQKGGSPPIDGDFLPRPRFSTRQYDALFVRIETQLSSTSARPERHPLQLLAEAFKANSGSNSGPHAELWEKIKKAGNSKGSSSPGDYSGLSHIFADETIRFLSLIPVSSNESTSPTFSLFLPHIPTGATRRRSFSMSDRDKAVAAAANAPTLISHRKPATEPSTSPTSESPTVVADWAEFSTSGFFETPALGTPLAATLLDKDVEVTVPRGRNKRPKFTPALQINGRKSLDVPRSDATYLETKSEETKLVSRLARVSLTQLDEAFIDFWSDALLDPISLNWPTFIICKLKTPLSGPEGDGKRTDWLVIEQAFKTPTPAPTLSDSHATSESTRRPRPSSPKPSFRSEITLASARKRFSFFTSSRGKSSSSVDKVPKSRKNAGQSPRVGEMGEILAEEEENVDTVTQAASSPKPKKSTSDIKEQAEVAKTAENGKANGLGILGLGAAVSATGAAVAEHTASLNQASDAKAVDSDTPMSLSNEAAADIMASPVAELATEVASIKPTIIPGVPETPTPVASSAPTQEMTSTLCASAEVHAEKPLSVVEPALHSNAVLETEAAALRAEEPSTAGLDALKGISTSETAGAGTSVISDPYTVAPVSAQESAAVPAVETETVLPTDAPEDILPIPKGDAEASTVISPVPAVLTPAPEAVEISMAKPLGDEEASPFTAHTEPLHVPGHQAGDDEVTLPAVPIVESEPILAITEPATYFAEDSTEAIAPQAAIPSNMVTDEELPPAPASVVLSGDTPGPQVALSTSEPVALAHIAEPELGTDELSGGEPEEVVGFSSVTEAEKASSHSSSDPSQEEPKAAPSTNEPTTSAQIAEPELGAHEPTETESEEVGSPSAMDTEKAGFEPPSEPAEERSLLSPSVNDTEAESEEVVGSLSVVDTEKVGLEPSSVPTEGQSHIVPSTSESATLAQTAEPEDVVGSPPVTEVEKADSGPSSDPAEEQPQIAPGEPATPAQMAGPEPSADESPESESEKGVGSPSVTDTEIASSEPPSEPAEEPSLLSPPITDAEMNRSSQDEMSTPLVMATSYDTLVAEPPLDTTVEAELPPTADHDPDPTPDHTSTPPLTD